ncbi:C2 domain-containing protein 3 [Saguinus oedipus]|uniref:C2 domain-containing protein 3 n=1 Tax=Saguinus oedipus TaxID=9490 RepID=A0ABQ9VVC2_SAGOE|nr:C2 domain-containing protein 3 [Saguinus oedipus]
MQISEDTEAGPAYSDEDYEEDIIEPRTLNEITTVTDKTSPWSSFISDTSEIISPQPDEVQREGPSCPSPGPFCREELTVKNSFLSSPERAVNSHLPRQGSPSQSLVACEDEASKAKNKEPESEAPAENEPATSELSDSADSFKKLPVNLASQSRRENHKGPPINSSDIRQRQMTTGSETSTKRSLLLPEPIVVPNFFLPPQQLEASLRMLSLSATLPPAATTYQDKSEATTGALSHRPCGPRPDSFPPNLPEEETRRIARIFSSQYSQED